MTFSVLKDACLPEHLLPIVDHLLEMKMASSEMADGPRINALNEFLDESILEVSEAISKLPSRSQVSWDSLNEMFYRLIREYAP